MDLDLSIVIIGKNESQNINRCIESVFRATEKHDDYEIIYVDSNSSDNTVELALAKNIDVYLISESNLYSASLGRHIGALKSNKNNILFLDGDMELVEGWIEIALSKINDNLQYAGIKGILDNYYIDNNGEVVKISENVNRIYKQKDAEYFGGAVLLKKKIS